MKLLAHCTTMTDNIVLRIGSTSRDRNGQLVKVSHVIQHPNFNPNTFDYDFSLLRFASLISFGGSVQPVKLPKEGEVLRSGVLCNVSGWGLTEDMDVPLDLRSTTVSIKDFLQCSRSYIIPEVQFEITKQMICAGEANPKRLTGNKDSCSGDSGGPLVCNGVQYGVVSAGNGEL